MKVFISLCLVLIMVTTHVSYGLNKEEFLRFLINTSYPEVKEEQVNEEIDKEYLEDNDLVQNDELEEIDKLEVSSDFIKVHIGKENKPEITTSTIQSENEDTEVITSDYIDSVRITKENPTLFLYHTHSSETYSDSPSGNFHSEDIEKSVMHVGKVLTDELEDKGWGVLHNAIYHDNIDYNKSYTNSLATIKDTLSKHESLEIAIDIHRDARPVDTEAERKIETDRMVIDIDGEEVAKIFFVVGPDNENVEQIRKIAKEVTELANEMYPGFALPVIEKEYGRFNLYLAKNHMLIEVGSNGTTTEQAVNSSKYIADVLDNYFKDYK
ncbi:MAG: stage II sporulation protein P [Peptostreptococcaceae bacterium]